MFLSNLKPYVAMATVAQCARFFVSRLALPPSVGCCSLLLGPIVHKIDMILSDLENGNVQPFLKNGRNFSSFNETWQGHYFVREYHLTCDLDRGKWWPF